MNHPNIETEESFKNTTLGGMGVRHPPWIITNQTQKCFDSLNNFPPTTMNQYE